MTALHRRVPTPPYKALRVIDGDYFKVCRWCDEVILKADGSPDRRRNWHPACVTEYLIRNDPAYLRRKVFERDRGLCAGCGFWIAIPVDREDLQGQPYTCRFHVGKQWYLSVAWQADHVVPLIDGGSFELDNVQTLCDSCHKAKTAREAGERAARRRPPTAPSPQIELFKEAV